MTSLIELISNSGMSEKESKVYLSALDLGEATIQSLSKRSGFIRTSLYYIVDKMVASGFLIQIHRNHQKLYSACPPLDLVSRLRQRIREFEDHIDILESRRGSVLNKPKMYFLSGQNGFKEAWNMIFKSDPREYCIITDGSNFLNYVKSKYIINEIISEKKKRGIKSNHIVVDSKYVRENILPKDKIENRKSRLLPEGTRLGFTEIICPRLVVFIAPSHNNSIFIIEDPSFAETRKVIFDQLWYNLPDWKR
jgi:sugar-specific transcriptional regulator TrmB